MLIGKHPKSRKMKKYRPTQFKYKTNRIKSKRWLIVPPKSILRKQIDHNQSLRSLAMFVHIHICSYIFKFLIYSRMTKNCAIYVGVGSVHQKSSPHIYAQSVQLYQTFSEITRIVARKNNLNTNQVVSQYINQCNKGEHVVLKSYSSFSKSMINRQCFLYNFSKIFETQSNIRNGLDYYQLFRLLCSDFPRQVVVNAVRIIEGQHQKMMQTLINSEKFLNALYLTFIYSEYLELMVQKLFSSNYQSQIPVSQFFQWVRNEDKKNHHLYEKPPIQIMYQIILSHLSNKNSIKNRGITFLTQQTIEEFINQNSSSVALSYERVMQNLVVNKEHKKLVEKNIYCFDNSSNWTNEAIKLLNLKQSDNPQPLNSKKMKKK